MTLPARIRRTIDIDGVRFDWCVSRRSGSLLVIVEHGRSRARISVTPEFTVDDAGQRVERAVPPQRIAALIRWARAGGWTLQPGLTELRHDEPWGRQGLTAADYPRDTIPIGVQARLEAVVQVPSVDPAEHPELAAELAALHERPTIAEGSVDVRLSELTDAEKVVILRGWLISQRARLTAETPEEIASVVGSPSGGLALWDDAGNCRVAPNCCCSLANHHAWRAASEWRGAEPTDLWTGHPWSEVRYEAPYLVITSPEGVALGVHPRNLTRMLAEAEAGIAALAGLLRPLLGDVPEAVATAWAARCAGR